MSEKKVIKNLENTPIEDDDIAIDKRKFIDDNIVDIYSKKSGEKTVEERIKTSRSLKIKNNRWNQVDYTEDFSNEKITIDPHSYQYNSNYEDVEFEQTFHNIIKNSKYKELLLGDDRQTITYQTINDIIIYCYHIFLGIVPHRIIILQMRFQIFINPNYLKPKFLISFKIRRHFFLRKFLFA